MRRMAICQKMGTAVTEARLSVAILSSGRASLAVVRGDAVGLTSRRACRKGNGDRAVYSVGIAVSGRFRADGIKRNGGSLVGRSVLGLGKRDRSIGPNSAVTTGRHAKPATEIDASQVGTKLAGNSTREGRRGTPRRWWSAASRDAGVCHGRSIFCNWSAAQKMLRKDYSLRRSPAEIAARRLEQKGRGRRQGEDLVRGLRVYSPI